MSGKDIVRFSLSLWLLGFLLCLVPAQALAQRGPRTVADLGPFKISMGLIGDQAWLFEISSVEVGPGLQFDLSLMTDPTVRVTAPSGGGDSWSGPTMNVRLAQNPPSINITDQNGQRVFFLSPYAPDNQLTGLNFYGEYSHIYGLGSDYLRSSGDLNLMGSTNRPANPFGNGRIASFGGQPNQVQAPVVYTLGEGSKCAALFVDETLPLQWSFTGQPWTVSTAGPLGPTLSFRFVIISGADLRSLRSTFMNLIGRPPVLPKKALGVWASAVEGVSDTDWREKVNYLKNNVPGLSGLLAGRADQLEAMLETARAFNLRVMADESAYVSQESPYYSEMARRSFLVRQNNAGGPIMVVSHDGQPSGLVDYTNSAAPTFWHSLFRADEISAGLLSYRLTDGDLNSYSPTAYYEGPPGSRVHSHYAWANSYALKWAEGLMAGFQNQRMRLRPRLFMVSRTGLPGLSRLSATLYNGEASLFGTRSLLASRANLSLSGFDFYSSDISQNLVQRPPDQYGQTYDTWLAKSILTDVPLMLPEDILLRPAARYNLALRESLEPYFYSLAWEAHLAGQPFLAPLAYYFQEDQGARNRVGEMMLGSALLVGLDFDGSAEKVSLYVPAGRWYNWRSGEVIDQQTSGLVDLDLKDAGQVTPPILAKGGAIIPGLTEVSVKGGAPEQIAALKIFIGQNPSEFTWYEDDGETMAYLSNAFGMTHISAVTQADGSTVVTIKARQGSWDGAPTERRLLVDIYGPRAPGEATLDNMPHNRVARAVELDQLESGWASFGANRIRFKTPPLDMSVDHVLWFK